MNSIPIHPTPSAYNTYYTPIAYSSQAPGLGISGFNFATCNAFNTLHFHSNANKKVIDTQCTSVLFSRVFVYTEPRPSLPILSGSANQDLRRPSCPHHFPCLSKFFRINTYETSRKCCKQMTYRISKPFRCNTYKRQGGVLWLTSYPTRIAVLRSIATKDPPSHAMKHVCPESGAAEEPKKDFCLIGRLSFRE